MEQKFAQILKLPTIITSQGPQPTIEFQGPLPTSTVNAGRLRFESLGDIITIALQYLFPIAGLLLFLFLVFGGFQLLTSSGDPKKVEAGRNRITYAVMGFVLLVASYWIVKIVELIISPNQPFF